VVIGLLLVVMNVYVRFQLGLGLRAFLDWTYLLWFGAPSTLAAMLALFFGYRDSVHGRLARGERVGLLGRMMFGMGIGSVMFWGFLLVFLPFVIIVGLTMYETGQPLFPRSRPAVKKSFRAAVKAKGQSGAKTGAVGREQ
jgi:hypothetical protein